MEPRNPRAANAGVASFGDLLRQARIAAALSQEELAERAGLSARGVSDLERGIHPTPRLETVRMLAAALALDDAGRAALLAACRPKARDALASPVAPLVALPVPPTRLVGREREVAEIRQMLGDAAVRLLTLTGAGGSGKTRLAIAAAADLGAAFPDGIVLVDLAPLSDPAFVPAAVAQALGLSDSRGGTVEDLLRAYLARRRVLLLLDNFEHLLDAAPFCTRLLAAAPGLTLMTTSREPLRLRGERELSVAPLPLPELESVGDIARLGACDSVTLFVERARDVRQQFSLSGENAAAVAEICRRLDGLPLALELAAARIRVLPPRALRARLGEALPVLTGGPRDGPARHRTLRETIAWSYNLLDAREQRLFRALGCFAGGWTLEAAEYVGGEGGAGCASGGAAAAQGVAALRASGGEGGTATGRMLGPAQSAPPLPLHPLRRSRHPLRPAGPTPPEGVSPAPPEAQPTPPEGFSPPPPERSATPSVLDLLGSLVEKNLVRLEGGGGELRYGMLETIREFALQELAACGEERAVRDRHAAWCLALGEESEPALEGFGGTQGYWLPRLDAELANVRAALAWFHHLGDARRLLRLATVLDTYWFLRPYHAEVDRWLTAGLRAPDVPADVRAAAWNLAMSFADLRGDWPKAVALGEESLRVAGAWGNAFGIGRAHYSLGQVQVRSGDVARAIASFSQAVRWLRQAGATSWIYLALAELGSALQLSGDVARAAPLLDEALTLVRQTDETDPLALQDRFGLSEVLGMRAYAARAQGDLALAARLFVEKHAIGQELGIPREALGALAGLAGIALDRGEPERAARLLGAVDAAREAAGLAHFGHFHHARQVADAARAALGEEAFDASWRIGQATPLDDAVADALVLAREEGRRRGRTSRTSRTS